MARYKLTLSYDGTNYSGWQVQPHSTSIQQIVEQALHVITHEPELHIIGAGRTDAGVHALAQVAHCTTQEPLDVVRFTRSMNGCLPHDIRLLHTEEVDDRFHAQRSATGKIYHYRLCLNEMVLPFERLYCQQVRGISLDLLREAAPLFVGTHDFSSFANSQHHGAAAKNPVRTIYRIDVVPTAHGCTLEFQGNGFLYKMVRNIVGTLLEVARGRIALDAIPELFAAKNRRRTSMAAPAKGLFLVEVLY